MEGLADKGAAAAARNKPLCRKQRINLDYHKFKASQLGVERFVATWELDALLQAPAPSIKLTRTPARIFFPVWALFFSNIQPQEKHPALCVLSHRDAGS